MAGRWCWARAGRAQSRAVVLAEPRRRRAGWSALREVGHCAPNAIVPASRIRCARQAVLEIRPGRLQRVSPAVERRRRWLSLLDSAACRRCMATWRVRRSHSRRGCTPVAARLRALASGNSLASCGTHGYAGEARVVQFRNTGLCWPNCQSRHLLRRPRRVAAPWSCSACNTIGDLAALRSAPCNPSSAQPGALAWRLAHGKDPTTSYRPSRSSPLSSPACA